MSDTPKPYESDTPETCEAVERWQQGKINIFDEMARLERERDEARASVRECEAEIKDLTIRARKAEREEAEALANMCQAIGHLSEIAETCQDWLDSIIQEPSVDFIKAIRDWAKKKVEEK
jgi:chromosome segregation ATPase